MCKKIQKYILCLTSIFTFIFWINIDSVYAITPISNLEYQGIDVSNWQGYIDYSEVKRSGIEVVYIKASQGTNIKDAYFEINYENAKANGLKVGFYHFLTATNTEEAEQEARFFASVISGKTPDCKLVMDYETFGGVGVQEANEIAQVFLETTKRLTNKDIIIYSDLSNSQSRFSSELAENYELWLAYYSGEERLRGIETRWNNYIGLQYLDRGRINGISGAVDLDSFSEEIFLDETSEVPITENPTGTINTETITYTVQRGDTLWAIARRYGTTSGEIAEINNISNPNLIYPGQELRIPTNSTTEGEETRGTGDIIYTVQRGDTLSRIAREYNVTVAHIVELNDITNPNLIYPGEKLRITESDVTNLSPIPKNNYSTYTVRRGDILSGIARRFGVSVNYLVRANNIQNPNLIFPGQILIV